MLRSLAKLCALPDQVPVILIDNGSNDGSEEAVKRRFPGVQVIRAAHNLGAAARNLGVREAKTSYVALCDDDTWWQPGSLTRGVNLLDAYPTVAVLTARLLNGPEEIEDPICRLLQASPLTSHEPLPGKPLLGFLAGASVVRRNAFLDAGGFDHRFFIGGEEELLALELAVRGWQLCYVPELVVHHYPSPWRDRPRRDYHLLRNRLWVSWLRRPAKSALAKTFSSLRALPRDAAGARALVGAVAGLPWILRERRVVPAEVEAQLCLLEGS
jgi:GT2 family glycosyltransferase